MLVLSRRPGEEIVIDGNIRLTLIAVNGSRIQLGVEAPAAVRVDRQEVRERLQEWAAVGPTPTARIG